MTNEQDILDIFAQGATVFQRSHLAYQVVHNLVLPVAL